MFLGLRTIIYPVDDLDAAKTWYSALLGVEPYFDQPFYVGYSVGGYELALDPGASVDDGPVTYWGVSNCDEAWSKLVEAGASPRRPVEEVGDSIRVATLTDPVQNIIGIIENPHFKLSDEQASSGPGL